ncbi:unnamed protein product [Fusarium graminearum]|uniref:Uncharacterized protein n=1 Tax=Gibberella zeae TaxID=5518 RepID=A0A2H3GV11_GIBZA|nr:hypothetical protein FG05_02858 [Fusarium graminearum]KAI6771768.1 hypothetical protein HG531_009393 [Fusarium graminearum]PCD34577.1 hypothetical protein FGRA07_08895 [Fusarium graminearum]CAF3455650.1 unnamed protein product [Fusarium graminearum]CAF3473423.1 unnamed protein product [Fusarium graminearum]
MAESKSCTKSEIPGLRADAHATSFDHFTSLEEFGSKWYASGVEAGLTQAAQDLATRKEKEAEVLKKAAMAARDALTSAVNDINSIGTEGLSQEPMWAVRQKLQNIVKEISHRRDECTTSIYSASQESKKRSSETQASDGGNSSKRSKND